MVSIVKSQCINYFHSFSLSWLVKSPFSYGFRLVFLWTFQSSAPPRRARPTAAQRGPGPVGPSGASHRAHGSCASASGGDVPEVSWVVAIDYHNSWDDDPI